MLTVIESKRFSLDAADLFTDTQLARLITFLSITPEAGDVMAGTGGFRKLRWSVEGRGKRGGARVIYLFWQPEYPLLLVRAYAKNTKVDLTPQEKQALREFAVSIKRGG
jgi:hypothetical protein